MNIYQRLLAVQAAVHAPRQEGGRFPTGSRSAEQILAEVKKPCLTHGVLIHSEGDRIEVIDGRRYLVHTVRAINIDVPEERLEATALAAEGEVETNRDGRAILDPSQVTGKASSYAKKYALQHLLNIDDTKDADNDAPRSPTEERVPDERAPSVGQDDGSVPSANSPSSGAGPSSTIANKISKAASKGHLKSDQLRDIIAYATDGRVSVPGDVSGAELPKVLAVIADYISAERVG